MPVRLLTPELREKAQLELLEDPKKLEDGIQHLRDWIDKQPHLKARTDDQWLATYLRGCKFSLERCKEKIDLYYSLRSIAPEINCLKVTDPKLMELLKSGIVLVLPKLVDATSPRIILLRVEFYNPAKYTHFEVMSVYHVLQQILFMEDDNYVICGGQTIVDLNGTSWAHFTQLSPVTIKQMITVYREALPTRMKGSHFLNTPKAFETIFSIIKSFLDKKINNRLLMHKNYDSLYNHVPMEVLPSEYGGKGGTAQEIIDNWVKKVEEYSAWFEEDGQFKTDERLRPGRPRTAVDVCGLEGSFRQLDFD